VIIWGLAIHRAEPGEILYCAMDWDESNS